MWHVSLAGSLPCRGQRPSRGEASLRKAQVRSLRAKALRSLELRTPSSALSLSALRSQARWGIPPLGLRFPLYSPLSHARPFLRCHSLANILYSQDAV